MWMSVRDETLPKYRRLGILSVSQQAAPLNATTCPLRSEFDCAEELFSLVRIENSKRVTARRRNMGVLNER
jgi:hypothetical protein